MNKDPTGLLGQLYNYNVNNYPVSNNKVRLQTYLPGMSLPDCSGNNITNIYHNVEYIDYNTRKLCETGNYCVVGSKILDLNLKNYCFYSWHMFETARVNKKYSIDCSSNKTFLADILLGNGKKHRFDFFEKINKDKNLFNSCLINLHREENQNQSHQPYSSPALDSLESKEFKKLKQQNEWTTVSRINAVNYKNQNNSIFISQQVPEAIYQNSYITVLFESVYNANHFFPTEKVAKPIVAGRIFLVSAGKNYLQGLRNLGFKTFEGLIDESYDQCNNHSDRNSAILAELKRLQKVDLRDLYAKATPILEHNLRLIYSKELWQPARDFVEKIFQDCG